MTSACGDRLDVDYFDGIWRQPHAVQMWVEQGMLHLVGKAVIRQIPLGQVQWSALSDGRAPRKALLPDDGKVCAQDIAGWDQWQQAHQPKLAAHARARSSAKWTVIAVSLLLAVAVWGYGCTWHIRP
ncbi:MAG: hypothetical protein KGL57_10080 [Burkholderiales bacterium]|nr:hypothetical protein [Burkholderiales bacterium]